MEIVKKTSTHNTSIYKNRPIQYIVLHYTAGTSSKKGVARNIANMFASPTSRAASADFIVDDAEIVEYNGDIKNRYTYAVGGNLYSVKCNKEAGSFYGKCRNYNSISIELCSSKKSSKTMNATDTDWYFTEAVLKNGAELTKYLMKTYNVPIERVICHFHVTAKPCPAIFAYGDTGLAKWYAFKKRLTGASSVTDSSSSGETKVDYYAMVTDATGLNCRNGIGTGFGIVKTFPVNTTIHIVKESYGWGYVENTGWVNLNYTRKVAAPTNTNTEKGVEDMTKQEFINALSDEEIIALYNKAMTALAKQSESAWSAKEGHWARAKEKGIVDGSAPTKPISREQTVAVLGRAGLI